MLIIDRFEGDTAVIEVNGSRHILLLRKNLPENAREGDVLKFVIDETGTKKRKKEIQKLSDKLFE
jgi:phosphoribosylformylglycinamidine (FGAM) synthase PurS component